MQEERRRRRELKVKCSSLEGRVKILEARLEVAEGGEHQDQAVQTLIQRNKTLESRVSELEAEAGDTDPSRSFEREYRTARAMLTVQEEIESTLLNEVQRLRRVVRAQRRAINRLAGEISLGDEEDWDEDCSGEFGGQEEESHTNKIMYVSPSRNMGYSRQTRASKLRCANSQSPASIFPFAATRRKVKKAFTASYLTSAAPSTSGRRKFCTAVPRSKTTAATGTTSTSTTATARIEGAHGESVLLPPEPRAVSTRPCSLSPPPRPRELSPPPPPQPPAAVLPPPPPSPDAVMHPKPWTPTKGREIIPDIIDYGLRCIDKTLYVDPNKERRAHQESESVAGHARCLAVPASAVVISSELPVKVGVGGGGGAGAGAGAGADAWVRSPLRGGGGGGSKTLTPSKRLTSTPRSMERRASVGTPTASAFSTSYSPAQANSKRRGTVSVPGLGGYKLTSAFGPGSMTVHPSTGAAASRRVKNNNSKGVGGERETRSVISRALHEEVDRILAEIASTTQSSSESASISASVGL